MASRIRRNRAPGRRALVFESLEDRRLLATVPDGFTESVVATELTSPITMDIDSDGRLWVAFQDGRIEVIENDMHLPGVAVQLDADGSGERGLQGIELDPDYESNHYLYVYYTAASPESHNRLSRLSVDPLTENTIIPGSEEILLELPFFSTFPDNQDPIWHMGGAIHFMADDTIAVQVGDHLNNGLVQDIDEPLGKILRVNKDGSPASDNPFYDASDGISWQDYVWSSGLRNPFSGDVDPETGRYFVNDVGQGSWEEINDATSPGLNFGWPTTEGGFDPVDHPQFTQPFHAYPHSEDVAITGGAFYSPPVDTFPAEYHGKYFFSQFSAGRIRVIDPDDPSDVETFATDAAFPMNIEFGPDGSMYYVARGAGAGGAPGIGTGQILKVQFAADIPPQIVLQPDDALVSVGYDASFSVSAAGSTPLDYQWQKDSGEGFVDIPGADSPTLDLASVPLSDNNAQYRVVVTNGFGMVTSEAALLEVTTDTPPTAEIVLPEEGLTYRAGDLIEFSGSATDLEDGELGADAMTWTIDFHHDTHSHPFLPPTPGLAGGDFEVPVNSETSANVWFRIHLSVTDSAGLTTDLVRDVFPETSDFTVGANIDGASILVDGQPMATPTSITGVVNVNRSLEAPTVASGGGALGQFVGWLDGVPTRQRVIATPEDDAAYVALYQSVDSSLVFLSNVEPANDPPPNGWGPIEYDTSNGEQAAGDGVPMAIGGVRYEKGLGVHAQSEVIYDLDGQYSRFLADIGVDDETGGNGSVQFQVYGDGELLYESDTRTGDGPSGQRVRVDVDVAGVDELLLEVNDAGNGNGFDHADWANARLLPVGAGENLYVNFQPGGSPEVDGYEADTGLTYGLRGTRLAYGWSTDHTGDAVDRDDFLIEELLETHIQAQENAVWEAEVANGQYAVTVSVGDAGEGGDDSNNSVFVEGVEYWNGLALGNDEFAQKTLIVNVADGRMTLDVGASDSTALNFIEVNSVPTPDGPALFPLFTADVDLDGKLTLNDVVDFGAGWGDHDPGLSHEQRVRLGDLDFDGDTDADDWDVLNQRWMEEGNAPISLAAVLDPIPGDFDRSGLVAAADYDVWRDAYGTPGQKAADANGDGLVNAIDFTAWRDNLGSMISEAAAPAPVALIAGASTDDGQLAAETPGALDDERDATLAAAAFNDWSPTPSPATASPTASPSEAAPPSALETTLLLYTLATDTLGTAEQTPRDSAFADLGPDASDEPLEDQLATAVSDSPVAAALRVSGRL